jgi:hypothetical protein
MHGVVINTAAVLHFAGRNIDDGAHISTNVSAPKATAADRGCPLQALAVFSLLSSFMPCPPMN